MTENELTDKIIIARKEQAEYERMRRMRHRSKWKVYKRFWMVIRFVLYFGVWFLAPILITNSISHNITASALCGFLGVVLSIPIAAIGPGTTGYIIQFLLFPGYADSPTWSDAFDLWYSVKFENVVKVESEGQKWRRLKKEEKTRLSIITLHDMMITDPEFKRAFLEL